LIKTLSQDEVSLLLRLLPAYLLRLRQRRSRLSFLPQVIATVRQTMLRNN
jgi:hypothetical protein